MAQNEDVSSTVTEKYPLAMSNKTYSSVLTSSNEKDNLENTTSETNHPHVKIDNNFAAGNSKDTNKHYDSDDDALTIYSRAGTSGFRDIRTISTPDLNIYQQKKTLAKGMMDLALFSANASQLRYVMDSVNRHPYFYSSVVLISFSILLQVAIGVGLVWNSLYNVKDEKEICIANKINNFTIIGIFLVTIVNVFICSFGVATSAPVT